MHEERPKFAFQFQCRDVLMSKKLSSEKLSAALARDKILLSAASIQRYWRQGAPTTQAKFRAWYHARAPVKDNRTLQEAINDLCKEWNRK